MHFPKVLSRILENYIRLIKIVLIRKNAEKKFFKIVISIFLKIFFWPLDGTGDYFLSFLTLSSSIELVFIKWGRNL